MIRDVTLRRSFQQVQLVPLTAFAGNGDLNLSVMRQQTERLFQAGVRVFIPCAGSSEFHSLLADEIVAAIRMTREVVGSEARVLVPLGLQLRYALELSQRAAAAGADGALIMPLNFPYVSNAGAREYYEAIFAATDLPCIVYKKDLVPSNELLLELAEHPRMLGVKYSLPDVSQFQKVVQQDGGRIDWYCGHAERYAPYFGLAGAPGYTSGAGNICPRVTLALHRALSVGDFAQALHWQRILLPIEEYRARDNNSYNVSFLKHAIRSVGLDFGEPRPPYRRLSLAEQAEVEQIVLPILAEEQRLAEAAQ